MSVYEYIIPYYGTSVIILYINIRHILQLMVQLIPPGLRRGTVSHHRGYNLCDLMDTVPVLYFLAFYILRVSGWKQ